MKPSVRDAFIPFTEPHEGLVHSMYADVKSLVTTGIGNLIDSPAAALALPWMTRTGRRASRDEVVAEWHRVKNGACRSWQLARTLKCLWPGRLCFAHQGWRASGAIVRLTHADAIDLVMSKLDSNDAQLRVRFPGFDCWPADAQLATHSMAWACGPSFRFPKLATALNDQDFETASAECTINPQVGTIVHRNTANRRMYLSAARVLALKFDPDRLYWPDDAPDVLESDG